MVLINGIKYACERCIRGHRVTTCTHTDQPLMMIKPKGRPSTLCEHCKNSRKSKNQHQKCTCQNKTPGMPHDSNCACKDDDVCNCQKSNSNNNKKKLQSTNLKKSNSISSTKSIQQQQPPPPPPIDTSDFTLFQRSNIHNLDNDNTNTSFFQSFDMDLSNGGSISSNDIIPPSNLTDSKSVASNLNLLSQGRVGMDYLNDFKPSTSPTRIGEVSVPIDEYVQPLQQMTTNLMTDKQGQGQGQGQQEKESSSTPQRDFFADIPVPFSGTGLLDLFQENSSLANMEPSSSTSSIIPSSINARSPTTSELSISNNNDSQQKFPSTSISSTSLSNFNANDSSTSILPFFQNVVASTASPLSPTTPSDKPHHHLYHQLPIHHSTSSSSSVHHNHHYQTHFSPYPTSSLSKQRTGDTFITSGSTSSTPTDHFNLLRRPLSGADSSDSLISLQQQQTLTNDDLHYQRRNTVSPSPKTNNTKDTVDHQLGSTSVDVVPLVFNQIDNLDLFDGNSIDSYLNKTNFNVGS